VELTLRLVVSLRVNVTLLVEQAGDHPASKAQVEELQMQDIQEQTMQVYPSLNYSILTLSVCVQIEFIC
jgi:hypothetical protein